LQNNCQTQNEPRIKNLNINTNKLKQKLKNNRNKTLKKRYGFHKHHTVVTFFTGKTGINFIYIGINLSFFLIKLKFIKCTTDNFTLYFISF